MASRNSGSGDSKEDTRERAPAAVDEFSELFLPGQTSASLADRRQHQPAVGNNYASEREHGLVCSRQCLFGVV